MAEITQQEFKRHLNTKFQIAAEDRDPIELELVEVTPYRGKETEDTRMERFSLLFLGPPTVQLPQYTYPLQHPELGVCHIFLVPVGGGEKGLEYEAVFNYFRDETK